MVDANLAIASKHQQAGQLAEAERCYRSIRRTQPNQPDALHLWRFLLYQTKLGNLRQAVSICGLHYCANRWITELFRAAPLPPERLG